MPLPIIKIEGAKKCPKCGSDKRATADYVQELKKGFYLPKDFNEDCLQVQVAFGQAVQRPLNIQQQVPVLLINFAVCGKCYTMYVTNITSVAAQMAPPPGRAR